MDSMKTYSKFIYAVTVVTALLTLSGCAGMSHRDRNTITGAGIGAVAGAVLTGGSTLGTVGGAAVGGVIGDRVGRK